MDKIHSIKIEQKSNNYHNIKNNNKNIKIKIDNILCPFGIDQQYGNSVVKLEINQNDEKHIEIINQIKELELKFIENFNTNTNEWKSLINLKDNNNIFLESKIKKIKNNILTKLSFNDKEKNYLKTIYELDKNFTCDVILEIPTIWDFRNNNEGNKIGFILNLYSINVH